jgi:hypothetical protein
MQHTDHGRRRGKRSRRSIVRVRILCCTIEYKEGKYWNNIKPKDFKSWRLLGLSDSIKNNIVTM